MTVTIVSDLPELEGLPPGELASLLEGRGRAAAVWRALRRGRDPRLDDTLSEPARSLLETRTRASVLEVEDRRVASCGTRKLRLALADGEAIETVLIPSARRTTVCVSTQAGCARGCVFCVTATMGLRRGLSAGEIVGQVLRAVPEAREAELPPVRNLVFMGMGEPLDNLDAVRRSLEVLCDPAALALGPSHVTLSTVGTSPEAIRATRELNVQLAWSLHAVDEALRRRLVPTARHGPRELREAFVERLAESDSDLFVEMTLIEDVNDSVSHAEELTEFLSPFRPHVRVNLLGMNPGREGLAPSPRPKLVRFRQHLRDRGFFCAVREPRGLEVAAACGQLAVHSKDGAH